MADPRTDISRLEQTLAALAGRFPDAVLESRFAGRDLLIRIKPESLRPVVSFLKTEEKFPALSDIIGLDRGPARAEGEKRFSLMYLIQAIPEPRRLRLVIDLDDGAPVDSVSDLYRSADWAEREIFDMFGLRFAGHPDLRRIYMPDEFAGHPLRKDFPLEGTKRGL